MRLERLESRKSAATAIRRAKVVLIALALAAAIMLVAVSSWPLKLLVVLVFVRGVFASDVMAFRTVARRRNATRGPSPAYRYALQECPR